MDMLHGPMLKKLFLFSLPIAASSILQQLFNSADTAVAGRFAGSQALAAVGGNSAIISLLINLFVGFSVGANVVIALFIGQGKKDKVNEVVHSAMALALVCGFLLLALGQVIARPLLIMIGTPDDVLDLAVLYLRIVFLGMPFFMTYNFGSAVLRSVGETKKPLYALIVAGSINVCLNLFFVIVCHMSVAGVAIATVISDGTSAILVVQFLRHEQEMIRLNLRKLNLNREYIKRIVQIGLPAGLQGVVFSLSNVCIQSGINSFGSDCVAGSSAAVNFEYFTYFVTAAFAQGAVTFTGQNYGARQFDRCKKIYWEAMFSAIAVTFVMCVVFVAGRYGFLALFTTDPDAMKYALTRMLIVEMLEFMGPTFEIPSACMRGMGKSMLPAILTVFGSCVIRVIWVFTVFPQTGTFSSLLIIYPISWAVTAVMVNIAYVVMRRKCFTEKAAAAV